MPVKQLASAEGTSYNGPVPEERILIVDDDREIVRLLRSYLQRERYAVSVAYDGETALHALRQESPRLMLLDLMLPDKDGWEITRTVRGDEKLANTLIIMLTARVEDTDKIIGLELGADDYVTKPFNPREVVARVRALLRRSAAGDDAGDGAGCGRSTDGCGAPERAGAGCSRRIDTYGVQSATDADGKPRLCLHAHGTDG